jgi:hypothetical protein
VTRSNNDIAKLLRRAANTCDSNKFWFTAQNYRIAADYIERLEAVVRASEEMRNWAGHYVADMAWQGFDRKPYQVELDAYDAARARVTLPPSPTSDGAGEGGN